MNERTSLHPRSGALLLSVACGMAAYGLSYGLGGGMLFYLPLDGSWTFHPPEGALRISYFGLLINALLGSLVGWGVGRMPWTATTLSRPAVVQGLTRLIAALFLLVWGGATVTEASHWLGTGQGPAGAAVSGTISTGSVAVASKLQPGDPAPDFRLQDADGRWLTRDELLANGPLVIFFYPRDETPGCTAEACGFQSSLQAFETLDATVVGVSADSVGSHRRFADHHQLTFPLLSDPGNGARRAFRVPRVLGLMPGRTTYVIDRSGTIRLAHHDQLNPTGHVTVALEAVGQLSGSD